LLEVTVAKKTGMDIDDEKVYNAIPLAIKGYREYIKQVEEFLERLEK